MDLRERPLPGDDVIPAPDLTMDRLLKLNASPTIVWPWLEQLGKHRAGWYLPPSVERGMPRSRRATRTVEPRWLGLSVGDEIADWGPGDPTFSVVSIEPPHHLVYWSTRPRRQGRGRHKPPIRLTWALLLSELGMASTSLHLRLRIDLGHPAGPVATYAGGFIDWLTVELLGRGLNDRLR